MKNETLTTCLEIAYRNWSVFQPDKKMVFKDWWKRFKDIPDVEFEAAFTGLLDSCEKFPTFAAMWLAIRELKRGKQTVGVSNSRFSREYYIACRDAFTGLFARVMNKEFEAVDACIEGDLALRELCNQRGLMSEYEISRKRQQELGDRMVRGCYIPLGG